MSARAAWAFLVGLMVGVWSGAACRRVPPRPPAMSSPSLPGSPAPRAPDGATRLEDMPRLPEDPEAGRRSQQQWREHLEHEELERQMAYDGARVVEHRALVAIMRAARARFDRARTPRAVRQAAATLPAVLSDARRRVDQIDHGGQSSRLLAPYAALLAILDGGPDGPGGPADGGGYARARAAALGGHGAALGKVRAAWDQQMAAITAWLTRVSSDDAD